MTEQVQDQVMTKEEAQIEESNQIQVRKKKLKEHISRGLGLSKWRA